jgi:hypothetical protein
MNVALFSQGGEEVESRSTDDHGACRIDRLWPGAYFAVTDGQHPEYVDQLFEGVSCPQWPPVGCDPTTGSPLAVGFQTSVRWVDFNLLSTGGISGRVTDRDTGVPLEGVRVRAWDSHGMQREYEYTDVNGEYLIIGLEAGDFFVATEEFGIYDPDHIDLLFDGIPCPGGPPVGCDPTKGTPVPVGHGATTPDIDFALPAGSSGLVGTVTAVGTSAPVEGVQIDVWEAGSGDYEAGSSTSAAGTFVVNLGPGDYVVSTDNPGSWVNQIWDGIVCPEGSAYNGDCDPLAGDVVTVTLGNLTGSVDFALEPTFAVFSDGFESGTTYGWDLTVP